MKEQDAGTQRGFAQERSPVIDVRNTGWVTWPKLELSSLREFANSPDVPRPWICISHPGGPYITHVPEGNTIHISWQAT